MKADGHPVHRETHAAARGTGQPGVPASHDAGEMLAVATEELIGAHAGKDHLDAARTRGLAHQQGVDGGRIAYRLVERVHHARQEADDVRRDLDLMQVDAEARRDLACVDGIIRHRLEPLVFGPEGDGVGINLLGGPVGQDGDDA